MARMSENRFFVDKVCTVGDTYSDTIPLDYIYGYSVECDWTVTPGTNAVIYLIASNCEDKADDKFLPIDCSAEVITTNDGKIYNITWPMYRFFKLKVHVIAGSVTMNANFYCKGV